jgi:hypothetical protein
VSAAAVGCGRPLLGTTRIENVVLAITMFPLVSVAVHSISVSPGGSGTV